MRHLMLSMTAILLLSGCEKASDPGTATGNAASDTAVLKEAQAAANEVLRNADQCEAAKAALPEANRKLDEAAGRVRTATGQETLKTLRAQVRTVEQNCP
jgi:hypothetical protein